MYWHGVHFGHVASTVQQIFVTPSQGGCIMKFGFNRPSGFRGEDVWKCWHTHIHTHTHTYIHTYIHTHIYIHTYTRPSYTISSPMSLKPFFQMKEFIFSEGMRISPWWALLSSMPMIPIYGKNLKKSSSPEPHGRWPGNLVCSIECSSTTMFVQIITIGWLWHILWQGQIWSLMLFLYGKKVKQWNFQKLMIWN